MRPVKSFRISPECDVDPKLYGYSSMNEMINEGLRMVITESDTAATKAGKIIDQILEEVEISEMIRDDGGSTNAQDQLLSALSLAADIIINTDLILSERSFLRGVSDDDESLEFKYPQKTRDQMLDQFNRVYPAED